MGLNHPETPSPRFNFHHLPDGTLDKGLHVIAASRSFYSAFKVSPHDTQGRLLYALGDGQWDIPRLRVLLEQIMASMTRSSMVNRAPRRAPEMARQVAAALRKRANSGTFTEVPVVAYDFERESVAVL